MSKLSIGLIETKGFVAAIQAVDAMCKSAGVTVAGYKKVGSGLATVYVQGEVGAVEVAVESGVAAARRVGEVASSLVIARPEKTVVEKLDELKKRKKEDKKKVAATHDDRGKGTAGAGSEQKKSPLMPKAANVSKAVPAMRTAVKKEGVKSTLPVVKAESAVRTTQVVKTESVSNVAQPVVTPVQPAGNTAPKPGKQ